MSVCLPSCVACGVCAYFRPFVSSSDSASSSSSDDENTAKASALKAKRQATAAQLFPSSLIRSAPSASVIATATTTTPRSTPAPPSHAVAMSDSKSSKSAADDDSTTAAGGTTSPGARANKKQKTISKSPSAASAAIAVAASLSGSNPEKTKEAKAGAADFEAFRKSVTDEADRLLHTVLPQKILAVAALATSLPAFVQNLPEPAAPPATATASGAAAATTKVISVVPCNAAITAALPKLKSELLSAIEIVGSIKLSVQLTVPSAQEGDNFGVGVQEEALSELSKAEDATFNVLEELTKYYIARAKLSSKMVKHPHIEDYRLSVRELDQKEYLNIKLRYIDLRNLYSSLYDLLTKNEEKIKVPRDARGYDISI